VAHFLNAPYGLPTSSVRPHVPFPLTPPSSDNGPPTSLERGGAGVVEIRVATLVGGIGD
jgi:hypothetical protein